MTQRISLKATQNIFNDSQNVFQENLQLEQQCNNTVQTGIIQNHIGSGILRDALTQPILFDSGSYISYYSPVDGNPIYQATVVNQPSDSALGNQLEVKIVNTLVARNRTIKVGIFGYDLNQNLIVETFRFRKNESQITTHHFTTIKCIIINDFDAGLDLAGSGYIQVLEAKPLAISRDVIAVEQNQEPDLFFRDFVVNGSYASLAAMLNTAMPNDNWQALFSTTSTTLSIVGTDTVTQIGEKFLATSANIQKIRVLLSSASSSSVAYGNLTLSLYSLQTQVKCTADFVPELAIQFDPDTIPLAQITINPILNNVPQPIDFFLNQTAVASEKLIPGNYYIFTIKNTNTNPGTLYISNSTSKWISNAWISVFAPIGMTSEGSWTDNKNSDLWFEIYTDAVKSTSGQFYESGFGTAIDKSLNSSDYCYNQITSQYFGSGQTLSLTAAVVTVDTDLQTDARTGQPVNTEQVYDPSLQLLNSTELANTSYPLVIAQVKDTNTTTPFTANLSSFVSGTDLTVIAFSNSVTTAVNVSAFTTNSFITFGGNTYVIETITYSSPLYTIVLSTLPTVGGSGISFTVGQSFSNMFLYGNEIYFVENKSLASASFNSLVTATQTYDFTNGTIQLGIGTSLSTYKIDKVEFICSVLGDINQDGVVDQSDLNLLQGLLSPVYGLCFGHTASFTSGLSYILPYTNNIPFSITVTGTWAGTLTFQKSVGGVWSALTMYNSSSALVTSTTANGVFHAPGFTADYVSVNANSGLTGTATVDIVGYTYAAYVNNSSATIYITPGSWSATLNFQKSSDNINWTTLTVLDSTLTPVTSTTSGGTFTVAGVTTNYISVYGDSGQNISVTITSLAYPWSVIPSSFTLPFPTPLQVINSDIIQDNSLDSLDQSSLVDFVNRVPGYNYHVGAPFSIVKMVVSSPTDLRDDDWDTALNTSNHTIINLLTDVNLIGEKVSLLTVNISNDPSWKETNISIVNEEPYVSTVFQSLNSNCALCEGVPAQRVDLVTANGEKTDLYVPNNIIIDGNLVNEDYSFYKVDLEIGNIVFYVPTSTSGNEISIDLVNYFVAEASPCSGLTNYNFPAMKFADGSFVDGSAVPRNQLRFAVMVESYMPALNTSVGGVGATLDDVNGILKLSFNGLNLSLGMTDSVITKVRVTVYMKKAGFNNPALVLSAVQVGNILATGGSTPAILPTQSTVVNLLNLSDPHNNYQAITSDEILEVQVSSGDSSIDLLNIKQVGRSVTVSNVSANTIYVVDSTGSLFRAVKSNEAYTFVFDGTTWIITSNFNDIVFGGDLVASSASTQNVVSLTGASGNVNLIASHFTATSDFTIYGNNNTGYGGSITISGGNSSAVNGGNLQLTSGTGGGSFPSGNISLNSANGSSGSGDIDLTTGSCASGGSGGVNINTGGTGGNSGSIQLVTGGCGGSSGGNIALTTGLGSGNSGTISLYSSGGASNSGDISIYSGAASINSGSVYITAGGIPLYTLHGVFIACHTVTSGPGQEIKLIAGGSSSGSSYDSTGPITIQTVDFTGANGNAGPVNIYSGSGAGSGSGGTINIISGQSGSSRIGNGIYIETGNSITSDAGITILCGVVSSGSGGPINISAGNSTTAYGGSVNITSGASAASGPSSGSVSITTANSKNTGNLTLGTGATTAGAGNSGSINMTTGAATAGAGNSGSINMTTGASGTTTGAAGIITISVGTSYTYGGNLTLQAGSSQSTTIGTNAGTVNINAGYAKAGPGGAVNITAGDSNQAAGINSGLGGSVVITAGNTLSYTPVYIGGNVILNSGGGYHTAGNIQLCYGTVGGVAGSNANTTTPGTLQICWATYSGTTTYTNTATFSQNKFSNLVGLNDHITYYATTNPQTIGTKDRIIIINVTSGSNSVVTLPSSPNDGDRYLIKATKTGASAGLVTITGTFDGVASTTITLTPAATLTTPGNYTNSFVEIIWSASAVGGGSWIVI
jgi:hypothetical protein